MKEIERKQRDEKIVKLLETHSQKDVAKMFNLCQPRVSEIARANGVKHKKSRLNMSKIALNIDYFSEINTPQKAYWLGFICADGYINNNYSKLVIMVKDLEVLEKIKKDIGSEHKISKIIQNDKRTGKIYEEYSLQITNELFVANIKKNGVLHDKSENLLFPEIDESLYPYFIAGLFDGDGSVSKHANALRCNLISTKEVLTFINDFFEKKFGWKPCAIQKVTKNKTNIYKAYWYKHSIDFLKYIYCGEQTLYLQRKYKVFENYEKYGGNYGRQPEQLHEGCLPLNSI